MIPPTVFFFKPLGKNEGTKNAMPAFFACKCVCKIAWESVVKDCQPALAGSPAQPGTHRISPNFGGKDVKICENMRRCWNICENHKSVQLVWSMKSLTEASFTRNAHELLERGQTVHPYVRLYTWYIILKIYISYNYHASKSTILYSYAPLVTLAPE